MFLLLRDIAGTTNKYNEDTGERIVSEYTVALYTTERATPLYWIFRPPRDWIQVKHKPTHIPFNKLSHSEFLNPTISYSSGNCLRMR